MAARGCIIFPQGAVSVRQMSYFWISIGMGQREWVRKLRQLSAPKIEIWIQYSVDNMRAQAIEAANTSA